MNRLQDTIFALSTPYGKSGIAIIRISGPNALKTLQKFTKKVLNLKPRLAKTIKLYSIKNPKELIDEAIVIYFKSPNSFTGNDVIELNIHGSIAIIKELLHELSLLKFLRIAEPGEFTKLALLSNKISLTQAEGLSDLLSAETTLQKKIALRQYNGQLDEIFLTFKNDLISILSNIEAYIDFPDDDISYLQSSISQSIKQLIININNCIDNYVKGKALISGVRIAIIGAANTGKSTFLNHLANKEIAIVSHIEGTTRDTVEAKLDIEGIPVILTDTAGIRQTTDLIELEGIKRSHLTAEQAELKILFIDASKVISDIKQIIDLFSFKNFNNIIIVINKLDLYNYNKELIDKISNYLHQLNINCSFYISLKENYNVKKLENHIYQTVKSKFSTNSSDIIINLRHYNKLSECLVFLKSSINKGKTLELIAEDIRNALYSIGNLLGRIDIDEILDEIFSSFCIGK